MTPIVEFVVLHLAAVRRSDRRNFWLRSERIHPEWLKADFVTGTSRLADTGFDNYPAVHWFDPRQHRTIATWETINRVCRGSVDVFGDCNGARSQRVVDRSQLIAMLSDFNS